jgi:hypothetical protein
LHQLEPAPEWPRLSACAVDPAARLVVLDRELEADLDAGLARGHAGMIEFGSRRGIGRWGPIFRARGRRGR